MSAAEEPRPTSLPGISLRAIGSGDMEFLFGLYCSTREAEMARTGWDAAEQESFLRMQFQAQHDHYQEHYRGANFDVVEHTGEPIGRFYVRRPGSEIGLMEITLRSEWRSRGIGGGLTRGLLDEARRNLLPVVLYVEPDNPAKRLYERLGFVDVRAEGPFYVRMHFVPPGAAEPADARPLPGIS